MRFTVTCDDGAPVEFECADTLVSRWVCGEILEGRTYPYLPFAGNVDVVCDVGANCGAASVYFARHYRNAAVHAFEPARDPLVYLTRNAQSYRNIRVHGFGLHSRDQQAQLFFGDGDSILGSIVKRDVNVDASEIVELRDAGAWAADQGISHIDLLKVDVEGCEVDVLDGFAPLLPTVKILYIEYDSRATRREIQRRMSRCHRLYVGVLFLDQGECVYLRNDVAANAPVDRLRQSRVEQLACPPVPFAGAISTVVAIEGDEHVEARLRELYPSAVLRTVTRTGNVPEDADVAHLSSSACTSDVLERFADTVAGARVVYTESTSPDAFAHIDDVLTATHELYLGTVEPDGQACVYLRNDVAAHPDTHKHLRELLRASWSDVTSDKH